MIKSLHPNKVLARALANSLYAERGGLFVQGLRNKPVWPGDANPIVGSDTVLVEFPRDYTRRVWAGPIICWCPRRIRRRNPVGIAGASSSRHNWGPCLLRVERARCALHWGRCGGRTASRQVGRCCREAWFRRPLVRRWDRRRQGGRHARQSPCYVYVAANRNYSAKNTSTPTIRATWFGFPSDLNHPRRRETFGAARPEDCIPPLPSCEWIASATRHLN
jgi:hypothetical protein